MGCVVEVEGLGDERADVLGDLFGVRVAVQDPAFIEDRSQGVVLPRVHSQQRADVVAELAGRRIGPLELASDGLIRSGIMLGTRMHHLRLTPARSQTITEHPQTRDATADV